MGKYNEVLEKVAKKELYSSIFWVGVLLLIIGIIWVSNYLYFKKMKNRNPKKYHSNKQITIHRQSIYASIILSVICAGLGVFLSFGAANIISDINRDIKENAYVTYDGCYCIDGNIYSSRRNLYTRWLSVDFDNDAYAFIYLNSFFEWISTEEGQFEGTVVYGKNSLIVVDIES